MSAPPRPSNPDRRPLPDGWITRYDEGYRAWYYVDTRAQPPRSAWDHPLDAPPPPAPTSPPVASYSPPSNAPSRNHPSSSQSYSQQPGPGYPAQPFNQPYPGGGYQGNQQDNRGYQGFQPQQGYAGTPPGNYGAPGWQQGWQQPQPQGYPVQQQPVQTTQQPARGRGAGGMGTTLLAGGGGLLAGALLMEGFEHHERREEEQAYDQGYDQGYDNNQDNGDFGGGGGDW